MNQEKIDLMDKPKAVLEKQPQNRQVFGKSEWKEKEIACKETTRNMWTIIREKCVPENMGENLLAPQ